MRVLFSSTATVELCNCSYYNNSLSAAIPRYKRLGSHLLCLATIKPCTTPTQDKIDKENVDFVDVGKINSLYSLLFTRQRNKKKIELSVRQSDICVVHLPSFIGEQVVDCARKLNKPCLQVIVACPWDAYWNYSFKGKLIAPFRYLRLRRIVSRANYVLYVTNHFLQNRYPTQGKSLGCSDVRLPTINQDVLARRLKRIDMFEQNSRPLIISTLAAVDVRYKGQEYVIRAIAEMAKCGIYYEYHLIGGGDITYLRNLAIQLNVLNQVIFYGSVPHDQIAGLLDDTDIYIQPSKQEGLPRALVEAMSRACPALGSRIAGIPELLDKNCVFKKGNVGEICKKLLSFTVESMKYYAIRNYEEAKNYEFSLLEKKRNRFIDDFFTHSMNELHIC